VRKVFEPTERTRLKRRPHRGSHDARVIFGILDAGLVCHLAYMVDGQPVCTPTAYWREGDRLYWHGSAASRMLMTQASGGPVCLTVSHVDGLVPGRSGFTHSVLYRSVMVFGRPSPIIDAEAKRCHMDRLIERLYPGRTREIRPPTECELAAITVLGMTIEEASAKVRDGGVLDPSRSWRRSAGPAWCGWPRPSGPRSATPGCRPAPPCHPA
jgi:nitroimidazol reductase NimA-like FMN-containing flavoprotein (pyridoxamine 5'-phosphate oxidase superfamily)